ncbi:LysM domain-containing protein [Lactobacillus sp.] [Lactiplantibacillus mudanjiangensis]|uniref:aggregation-promoting factor n=1 Tax=Lactiplantibacillus mudanjiangensis TaxID=1296538 RepID=UPI001013F070|nr:LysM domain-containing protein [Lactobacillus sp.] [Lactiplantibacillus mudanjiangensis]
MKIKSLVLSTVAAAGLLVFGAAAANADTVTVKAGDTVSSIAKTHDTTVKAIEAANSLDNVNLIFVGQELEVNGTTTQTSTTTSSQAAATTTPAANTTTQTSTNTASTSTTSSSDSSAKAWIANKESGGSYSARNGQYVGKYQLSSSYLNGDYSAANQERVANSYVASRYGSWAAAQAHWQANGWY